MKTTKKNRLKKLKKQLSKSLFKYFLLYQNTEYKDVLRICFLSAKIARILVEIESLGNTQKPD